MLGHRLSMSTTWTNRKMLKYDTIKRQKNLEKNCDLLNLQEANIKKERPLKK